MRPFLLTWKIQQIPRLFNSFYCLVDIGHNPPSSSPAAPHGASSLYHIFCFCCLDSHVSWNHHLCWWSHACSGQSRWMTGGDVLPCHVWPGSSHSNPLFLMKDICYFDDVFFRDFPGVFSVFSALFCLALQKKSFYKLYPSGSLRFPQTSDIGHPAEAPPEACIRLQRHHQAWANERTASDPTGGRDCCNLGDFS